MDIRVDRYANWHKQSEATIESRLEFEKIFFGISARFGVLSDIDSAINASLADIGRLSGASRSYLFLFRDNNTVMDNTHEWCDKGVRPQIDNLKNIPSGMAPWWMEKLNNKEVIHIEDVSNLPPEAKPEKEILESQDIKSLLVIPVTVKEKLVGFIGFDNVTSTGKWEDGDLATLRVTSEIIGTALERKHAEEALQKAKDEMETRVKERTAELSSTVELLTAEIARRKGVEKALRKSEKDLRLHADSLMEANAALKVLVKHREDYRREFEERILSNVKNLILPYIEKIKNRKMGPDMVNYVNILESNLNDIVSPFSLKVSSKFLGLTPKEIQVAGLLKDGKESKDIAKLLNLSFETINCHRQNIRKKLGLKNKKINLKSYLSSLSE